MDNLRSLIKAYEKWVAANPDTVGDVETTTKCLSYFIAGRISDSNIVSELVYSLSNMLILYNDRIIDKARNTQHTLNSAVQSNFCYRLKVMLTTLEYSEVFIEISAKRVFGTKGKWVFVVLLQLAKAVGRLFILKHSVEQIITSPAMPNLHRKALIKPKSATVNGTDVKENLFEPEEHNFAFQLKRSGRMVRKIEGAPPMILRDFNLQGEIEAQRKKSIPKELLQAEYLYVAKPLLHLAAVGIFGERRWKQYATALAIDLISIRFYYKNRHLMTKQQKLEMSRRCVNLLLYLMRSPFYERYTQSRLDGTLGYLADNLPFIKMLASPLRDYIPHWQDTYFYLWST